MRIKDHSSEFQSGRSHYRIVVLTKWVQPSTLESSQKVFPSKIQVPRPTLSLVRAPLWALGHRSGFPGGSEAQVLRGDGCAGGLADNQPLYKREGVGIGGTEPPPSLQWVPADLVPRRGQAWSLSPLWPVAAHVLPRTGALILAQPVLFSQGHSPRE